MFRFFGVILCMCLVNINCQRGFSTDKQARKSNDSGEGRMVSERNVTVAASKPWQKVLTTDESFSSISFGEALLGIATGTDERFWLTENGGVSWSERTIRGKALARSGGAYSLAKAEIDASGNLHALGHLEEVGSAIFTSVDRGKTFTVIYYENASLNGIESIEDHTWVVGTIGSAPVVLHSKGGGQWTEIWKGLSQQYLSSVDFVDPRIGWSAGAKGLILHTIDGGHNWLIQQASSEANLESVAFADAKSGYVVGQMGTILHTADSGNTWERQDGGTQATLTNVVAISSSEAWVVGQKGMILHTNDAGQRWHELSIGTRADIYAITIKHGEIWLATADGTILKSSDR
jgi:photosystem II stability/assembly factor-like uncharacterized protein